MFKKKTETDMKKSPLSREYCEKLVAMVEKEIEDYEKMKKYSTQANVREAFSNAYAEVSKYTNDLNQQDVYWFMSRMGQLELKFKILCCN